MLRPMDLSSIAALHPHYEDDHGLLILELLHGKANEMGSPQLDAFDALCDFLEAEASISCLCTTSRRVSPSASGLFTSSPGPLATSTKTYHSS